MRLFTKLSTAAIAAVLLMTPSAAQITPYVSNLFTEGLNAIGQRNGTNGQCFRVYNKFIDANNYERLAICGNSTFNYTIRPEAAGSGTAWSTIYIESAPRSFAGTVITVNDYDRYIIATNAGGTTNLVLPDPTLAANVGRSLRVKTIVAQTVVSTLTNVVPLTSATAGTAILAAGPGKWADLLCDGVNWVIMAGN